MTAWQYLALAGLGAFHGLNPGMGWLFAVAIGLQERRRAALVGALPPIAAGHALSVLVVAVLVGVLRSVVATQVVAVAGAAVLVGFGLWRALSKRHFRWAGMRLSAAQLTGWSFLMSSVHGAGLMLLPVLVAGAPVAHHGLRATGPAPPWWQGLTATAVHTAAMVAVAGAVAILVYEVLGLRVLRTAWINLDRVWAFALIGSGLATAAWSST
jgi:threonine/homoserine/homoserine lactone efflux protein